MENQKRDNDGVLFKNDRKTSDTFPDYKGSATVNGIELWVSAWIKTPKAGGNKFLSLAFKPKEEKNIGLNKDDDDLF
jgi:hypothetical protein